MSTAIVAAILLAALMLPAAASRTGNSSRKIKLDRCVIVADKSQPSYVLQAIEDLSSYLNEITGVSPSAEVSDDGTEPVIVVGTQATRRVTGELLPVSDLGEEGYFIKTFLVNGRKYISVGGAQARGTKFGVVALMKLIRARGRSAYVDAPIEVKHVPSFKKRGMHLNGWAFNYPYSFRSWKEQDWKSYIDILGYHGANLVFIWPFMEIMPIPLSKQDEAYLREFKRVCEYAQARHGMEVWLMQSPNRVASDDCGVSDPRKRPYWRVSQVDLDPSDPEQFARIMKSREVLYRIVNNVDGVCVIDGDPGECSDSPLSEYARILGGCRTLLDKYNTHGKKATLVNWMWGGWGRLKRLEVGHTLLPGCFTPEFQSDTLQVLKERLTEPWGLISGQTSYLPICDTEGVLGKTVFLPYGTIEGEPAYPVTNLRLREIRANLGVLPDYKGIGGVMGNAQTPLLQLPDVYFYLASLWDFGYLQSPDRQVFLDLSGLLYPDNRELIADCFAALNETDPDKLETLVTKLDTLVGENRLSRPGLIGRKLFPDHKMAAESLLMQLKLKLAQTRLLRSGIQQQEYVDLLEDYFDAYLTWDTAHGWHNLWGWGNARWLFGDMTRDPGYEPFVGSLAQHLVDKDTAVSFFEDLARTLTPRHEEERVRKGCIEPMLNAVLAAIPIRHDGMTARATASLEPEPEKYPASAAIDGLLGTRYKPGDLSSDNSEWLQLTWDTPRTLTKVVVYFLRHAYMNGRIIRLQKESARGQWQDFATTVVPAPSPSSVTPYALAIFDLPAPVTLGKVRVVNLADVHEIEVR